MAAHMAADHEDADDLSDRQYARLAELRHALRSFLQWSAAQAHAVGLTPAQHQLLLAIRASPEPAGPTVKDISEILLVRHHSAVELADRAQKAGLITRHRDDEQHSLVRLRLTEDGTSALKVLSRTHLRELAQLAPAMRELLNDVELPDALAPIRR